MPAALRDQTVLLCDRQPMTFLCLVPRLDGVAEVRVLHCFMRYMELPGEPTTGFRDRILGLLGELRPNQFPVVDVPSTILVHLVALLLLSALTKLWGLKHRCSFNWYSDSKSAISRFHKFCGRRRSLCMPPDSDLLSIISTSLKALRRSSRPIWIKAHQDDQCSYDRLPLAARLNIDADFLATRYREHGRLRCISTVDHRAENVSTLYLNGSPLTSQYDECVRFHINGYHQRAVE